MKTIGLSTRFILTVMVTALALAGSLSSQIVGGQWETLRKFDGATANEKLGESVSGAGDVDGDGFDDLIVGAWGADPNGAVDAGSAYVYSGATGRLIWQFDGATGGDLLGFSVSGAGDVNGDGFADVIVGARDADPSGLTSAGSAYVYSGATGGLLWRFDGAAPEDWLGWSVSGAGDVNGDGFDDLIVGAWAADPGGLSYAGSAYVYSGATGVLLWQFDGAASPSKLGMSVSAAGDVDGDSFGDLIVGAPECGRGSALVYSGATGVAIWQFNGVELGGSLGESVSGAGDVDGDGLSDLIVGAPNADPGGLWGAGSAYVYSGATGRKLWQFDGTVGFLVLGSSVSGAGDVDSDGFDDLIVGAPLANPGGLIHAGSAYVYSGATGELLWQFDGSARNEQLGGSVSIAGDVNGNGGPDLIVGASDAAPGGLPDAGSAYVYSLDPFLHTDTPELSATSGAPVELRVDFPASEAGRRFAILASATGTGPMTLWGVEVPLTPDPLLWQLRSGWTPSVLQGNWGLLDHEGDATARVLSDPVLAPYVGQTIYLAAVSWGPVARLSSIARPLTIVP